MSRRGILGKKPKAITVCLPLENWPASDKALWERANRAGDVLDEGGFGCHWAPSTRAKNARDYGRWLAWITRVDPPALQLAPLLRLTRPNLQAYIDDMQSQVAPNSVACFLSGLGSIAWAFSEGPEYSWISRAARRVAYRASSSRNKRQRIRPSDEIVRLGFQFMNEAESPELRALNAAVRFRNGLAIALLAYRPARRANMSNIRIGQHLAMRGASYWITFAAHETKQRNAIEFEVPPSLTAAVDRYLKTFRPVLITAPPFCGTAGDAFWVSADGGPLSVQGFYKMIVETTKSGFGESINPHLFRDCAATTVAIDDPGSAAAIAGILGHSSIVTSERHYNQARSIDASRRYQGILAGLRRLTRSQRASAL